MNRTILATVVGALAIAGVAGPASAKPKTINGGYDVSAPTPDPTNYLGAVPGQQTYSVCAQNVPGSYDKHAFKATKRGKLSVTLGKFTGDWDLLITDAKGNELTNSGSSTAGTPANGATEAASVKLKKPGTVYIIACNWAGGPTGHVDYTYQIG